MPCHVCHTRQTDPVRGGSPWKRAVAGGEQVLVCPSCQAEADWAASVDRCPSCGSAALVRALGQTQCRECGRTGSDPALSGDPGVTAGVPLAAAASELAVEVAAAIRRVLGER